MIGILKKIGSRIGRFGEFLTVKNVVILVVVVALGSLMYAYKGLAVAALVNGRPISRLAVLDRLEKVSGKQILEALIREKIVNAELDAKGIKVTDEEVEGEIKDIESRVAKQGLTLDQALESEGIMREDLYYQIAQQMRMKKLFADKIQVTDEEIADYIKSNSITPPKGAEDDFKKQIKIKMEMEKLGQVAGEWVETLHAQASIRYFVNY